MSPAPASDRPRVWLTGHSGFTGQHLAVALADAGFEPVAAPHLPDFDLRSAESITRELSRVRPDYVIHLAAVSFVGHGNAADFYQVNTVGTTQLLDCILASALPVRKVIVASSANIYGNTRRESITEDTPPAPVNHYACSKLAMEHMARTLYDRLPLLVVRPFNYTGVGQADSFLVPKMVRHFAQRAPVLKLGNLDVVRDFSDVRMLAAAYCRLLTSPLVGTEVNICSGTGQALQTIIDTLAAYCGFSPRIEVDPALVRAAELKRLIGSNARLVESIGALPYGDFNATLRWMVDAARV